MYFLGQLLKAWRNIKFDRKVGFMRIEKRKVHLIGEVIKQAKKRSSKKERQPTIYDFVGILTKQEASQMRKAIEETCETIHPDDWK